MKWVWFLPFLGVTFLVASKVVVMQFLARAQSPPIRLDPDLISKKVSEVSIGILVQTVSDWTIAGLGTFLLFLYLKTKALERELIVLQASHPMVLERDENLDHFRDAEKRRFRLAIVGLVLSCSGVLLGPLGCLAGIVCGHLARRQIQQSGSLSGERIATAALIVGYLLLPITTALGVIAIVRLHYS